MRFAAKAWVALAVVSAAALPLPAATLRYWVAACDKPASGCKADDPQLAQWAMEAWQAASAGKLKLEKVAQPEHAHIRINWVTGSNSLYGEARPIMVDGQRGAEVYVLPTTGQSGGDPLLRETIVYLTCLHESGHALGLEHTDKFADIMYSFQFGGDITEYFGRYRRMLTSRADIPKHAGMSDDDRRQLAEILR
jgi:hypothetical protein